MKNILSQRARRTEVQNISYKRNNKQQKKLCVSIVQNIVPLFSESNSRITLERLLNTKKKKAEITNLISKTVWKIPVTGISK